MPTIQDNNLNFPRIKITHVPTGKTVTFTSYITQFSDNFNSSWESTDVFGRMDDIKTFRRTSRTISLGWNIVSESVVTAKENYEKSSLLMAMLYPTYNEVKATTISPEGLDVLQQQGQITDQLSELNLESDFAYQAQLEQINSSIEDVLSAKAPVISTNRDVGIMNSPPILKINFANLIKNSDGNELYGIIEGFKYTPDMDMGFFIDGQGTSQMMYPKIIDLTFDFTVIHTSKLGWKYENGDYRLRDSNFPFYKKR